MPFNTLTSSTTNACSCSAHLSNVCRQSIPLPKFFQSLLRFPYLLTGILNMGLRLIAAASDGNGIYLGRLNECDRYPTMKTLWRRTGEYGIAMTLVSRATWRDGGHLNSAVDLRDRVGIDPTGRMLAAALSIRPSWYHSLDKKSQRSSPCSHRTQSILPSISWPLRFPSCPAHPLSWA